MPIPVPDGFKPIELDDKPVFDELFSRFEPEISEYTFTNLFMWRDHYRFAWRTVEGTLLLLSFADERKIVAFPPVGSTLGPAIDAATVLATDLGLPLELHRLPESCLQQLQAEGCSLAATDDRSNWDYVYRQADLSTLQGPDYADMRKKISRFTRDNDWTYKPLDEEAVTECLEFQTDWCTAKACHENPSLHDEDIAIREALDHWQELGFTGGIITAKGKVLAYTLGEALTSTCAVVHVEKGSPAQKAFGAYQAINQQFAKETCKDFEFINREQDLGEPGLRRSKEAYAPVRMVRKHVATVTT
jgi:hypothetical protein